MKSFNFETDILIDLRSKVPSSDQFRDQLRMHLIDRILFFDKPFPDSSTISKITHVDQTDVKKVLESLEKERLLYFKDQQYFASYPKFTLSFEDQSKSLLLTLENNGIKATFKRHDSVTIEEKELKKRKLMFKKGVTVHETRIDYFGDDLPFAVTYNYTPTYIIKDIDKELETNTSINQFYKAHTKTLKKEYSMDSVIYPEYVADVFSIPYGKAGLLIKADYYDDLGQLVNVYRGYINGWFSIHYEGH